MASWPNADTGWGDQLGPGSSRPCFGRGRRGVSLPVLLPDTQHGALSSGPEPPEHTAQEGTIIINIIINNINLIIIILYSRQNHLCRPEETFADTGERKNEASPGRLHAFGRPEETFADPGTRKKENINKATELLGAA